MTISKAPERWAIRDAGIVHFYDIVTGKLIVSLPTLKTSGLEFSGETVYARGGFGNPKLVGFSSNREGKLALQDAIFDNNALAMLTGNKPEAGKAVIDYNEIKAVVSNKITLSKTPIGAIVGIYKYEGDGTNGQEITLGDPTTKENEYSIQDKVVTFHTSIANDTKIRVYYKVETDANTTTTVKVTSDKFGQSFRVSLDCLVTELQSKDVYKAQIQIPTAKFEDNFSFDLSVDGDPAVLDLNLELLKPADSTDMFRMVIYDEAGIQ